MSKTTQAYMICARSGVLVDETADNAALHSALPIASAANTKAKQSMITLYTKKKKCANNKDNRFQSLIQYKKKKIRISKMVCTRARFHSCLPHAWNTKSVFEMASAYIM